VLEHEHEMVLYEAHEGIVGGHNVGKETVHEKCCMWDYGGHHYLKNLRIIVSVVMFSNGSGSHQGEMNYHSFHHRARAI
jgi:hypothetical protein